MRVVSRNFLIIFIIVHCTRSYYKPIEVKLNLKCTERKGGIVCSI